MQKGCFERLGRVRSFIGIAVRGAFLCCGGLVWSGTALAQTALYPVGRTQVEYVDLAEGGRHLAFALFYPAAPPNAAAPPYHMKFFDNLRALRSPRTPRPVSMRFSRRESCSVPALGAGTGRKNL